MPHAGGGGSGGGFHSSGRGSSNFKSSVPKQINMVILIQDITLDLAFIIIEYIFHLILIKECFML